MRRGKSKCSHSGNNCTFGGVRFQPWSVGLRGVECGHCVGGSRGDEGRGDARCEGVRGLIERQVCIVVVSWAAGGIIESAKRASRPETEPDHPRRRRDS